MDSVRQSYIILTFTGINYYLIKSEYRVNFFKKRMINMNIMLDIMVNRFLLLMFGLKLLALFLYSRILHLLSIINIYIYAVGVLTKYRL